MSLSQYWNGKPLIGGRWTLKDVVQGKPRKHPTHALFVHFPSALLPFTFVLDAISRLHADSALVHAAFYDVAFGLIMASGAAITGLVDYLPMIGGSRKKKLGTYHLLLQVPAVALFAISLIVRAYNFDAVETPLGALVLAGIGTASLLAGNYFGGELVYRQGMRVSTDM